GWCGVASLSERASKQAPRTSPAGRSGFVSGPRPQGSGLLRSTILMMSTSHLCALALLCATSIAAAPTFSKDVAPILQNRCQICHRPGEAGPFSLMTYDQARPWAKAIKTAVIQRKMPPWFADPHYGKFSNDASLTKAEIDTLAAWADAGAPLG